MWGMTHLSPAETAALDQRHAAEREFARTARPYLVALVGLYLVAGLYAALALQGALPMPAWAPAAP